MNWLATLLPWLRSLPSFAEDELAEDERPVEATELDLETPVTMPLGKGIFVQSVEGATGEGTAQALANRAVSLKLSWVTLLVIWQHSDRDRIYKLVEEASAACRAAGIEVWLWGWPERKPARRTVFIDTMRRMLEQTKARGIMINAERPYYGYAKEAAALASELRNAFGSQISIGLSSYGLPDFHPRFPWSAFAPICDFGMPQIYDSDHNDGPKYPQRCITSWTKKGYKQLVPTWGASKAHTSAQMREFIERTPKQPGCCWWDMNWLRTSTLRAAVIREMDWYDDNAA